ncbi:hypothetical protein CPC08DRAFT_391263 [Agrocybe pediades]|nr:hypothetical protein CPC08DRAFT_391263 [Agrocybe pediades]
MLPLLLLAAQFYVVQANIDCLQSYSWAYNKNNQSPCDVSWSLIKECDSTLGDLTPLPNWPDHSGYYNISTMYKTYCLCNTITYSLVSACSICQGQSYTYWSEWSDECDGQATLYEYKEPIPTGLDVPSWAYLDVTTKNYFDLNAAFKNATASKNLLASNNPSSTQSESFVTPTPVPPSTNSNSNTPISNIIYNNVTMPDSDSKKDDSKVDIPALIGALTGAISGLVLATLAVLKYRAFRRNRAQKVKDADTEQLDLVDGPEPEDEWEKEDSDDEQGHEYTGALVKYSKPPGQ